MQVWQTTTVAQRTTGQKKTCMQCMISLLNYQNSHRFLFFRFVASAQRLICLLRTAITIAFVQAKLLSVWICEVSENFTVSHCWSLAATFYFYHYDLIKYQQNVRSLNLLCIDYKVE